MEIKKLQMTCGACPEQYEGETTCGKQIYIRIRFSRAYIKIDDEIVAERSFDDDGYKGNFEGDELKELLAEANLEW